MPRARASHATNPPRLGPAGRGRLPAAFTVLLLYALLLQGLLGTALPLAPSTAPAPFCRTVGGPTTPDHAPGPVHATVGCCTPAPGFGPVPEPTCPACPTGAFAPTAYRPGTRLTVATPRRVLPRARAPPVV